MQSRISLLSIAGYVGNFNNFNNLCNKVCVANKTEDLNLSVFNMITGIYESKILTKH